MSLERLHRLLQTYGSRLEKQQENTIQNALKEDEKLHACLEEEKKLDSFLDSLQEDIIVRKDFLTKLQQIPQHINQFTITPKHIRFAMVASIVLAMTGFILGNMFYLPEETVIVTEEWFWQFSEFEKPFSW